jgi:hypothetical protein
MPNTSATGGHLQESGAVVRVTLEDLWQSVLTGITALPGDLVRPANQEDPGPTPGSSVTWAAFQIIDGSAEDYPYIRHYGDGDGYDIVTDWAEKNVLVSVYGPDADDVGDTIRRALHVGQNRDALRLAGVAVTRIGVPQQMPELVNEKWLRRVDLWIYTSVETRGTYQILNILRATGILYADLHGGNQLKRTFDTNNVEE